MQHQFITETGETLHLTNAVVTVLQQDNRITEDKDLSTEHVTYWKKFRQ